MASHTENVPGNHPNPVSRCVEHASHSDWKSSVCWWSDKASSQLGNMQEISDDRQMKSHWIYSSQSLELQDSLSLLCKTRLLPFVTLHSRSWLANIIKGYETNSQCLRSWVASVLRLFSTILLVRYEVKGILHHYSTRLCNTLLRPL